MRFCFSLSRQRVATLEHAKHRASGRFGTWRLMIAASRKSAARAISSINSAVEDKNSGFKPADHKRTLSDVKNAKYVVTAFFPLAEN
jgi:hypothetical protein